MAGKPAPPRLRSRPRLWLASSPLAASRLAFPTSCMLDPFRSGMQDGTNSLYSELSALLPYVDAAGQRTLLARLLRPSDALRHEIDELRATAGTDAAATRKKLFTDGIEQWLSQEDDPRALDAREARAAAGEWSIDAPRSPLP
jgi:hypothetical protein